MNSPVVIIGIGELAGIFARGFLRCGYPVYPITRNMDLTLESQNIPDPCLVLITVQESELHPILEKLPDCWRDKVGLLQNELLPRDWQLHHIQNPTVTVVWFEKKPDMELTNILYTPSFGPNADLIGKALKVFNVPSVILQNEEALLYELTRKSLYIQTVNICGLVKNLTVSELWNQHQSLARQVAEEVINILEWLTGQSLDQEKLIAGMVEGINDCPHRYCLGRRAQNRLERALDFARQAGIKTPKLTDIYQNSQLS